MIQQKYQDIIDQCKARPNDLSDWEREQFLPRCVQQKYLSVKQKQILDRIVAERFNGEEVKQKPSRVTYQEGRINATQTDDGWMIELDETRIGLGLTRKEAVVVTAWLNDAVGDLAVFFGKVKEEEPPDEIDQPEEDDDPPPYLATPIKDQQEDDGDPF